MVVLFCYFFFFQAEDGIRDLVRSRGLGDVYKRQEKRRAKHTTSRSNRPISRTGPGHVRTDVFDFDLPADRIALEPVSYTHLTLPTSDLV